VLGDKDLKGAEGDMVTLPLNIPHSIHNRSGKPVKAIFSVSPTQRTYEFFQKLHNMTDKPAMAQLAADYNLPFV
jgi:mannose-6-phosphate isomerase-like protein (cupin superfamily)